MHLSLKLASVVVGASLLQLACSSDTNITIIRAPGFEPKGASVSVFAVYSDGRLNTTAWENLGPRMRSLGKGPCEAGFGESMRAADKVLFVAVEQEARKEGITDDMITKIAPSAKGDLVLIVELWGALASQTNEPAAGNPSMGGGTMGGSGMGSGMGGGGMGGFGGGRMRPSPFAGSSGPSAKQQDALRMVARAFSPETNEWVGEVELRYSGDDANEAIARFDEAVGKMLPASHCTGWAWKTPAAPSAPPAPSASTSAPDPP